MGLGLWKLGWPDSLVARIFPGILLLKGLGLVPGLDFFGMGCRWTSGIMDALSLAISSSIWGGIWAFGGHLERIRVFGSILDPGLSYKIQWTDVAASNSWM